MLVVKPFPALLAWKLLVKYRLKPKIHSSIELEWIAICTGTSTGLSAPANTNTNTISSFMYKFPNILTRSRSNFMPVKGWDIDCLPFIYFAIHVTDPTTLWILCDIWSSDIKDRTMYH